MACSAAAPAWCQAAAPADRTPGDDSSATVAAGGKRVRAAEDAYLAGAKKLQHGDLSGAENEFTRALALDPDNRDYAIAVAIAREHRVTELVQKAAKARLAGNPAQSETLLADARAIDPANPLVLEHTQAARSTERAQGEPIAPLTDRARLLAAGNVLQSGGREPIALAGVLVLAPSPAPQSFHLRGDSEDIVRKVAAAYGIRVVFDESVEHKTMRFDLDNETYGHAMPILLSMTHLFAAPLDVTSVLLTRDSSENRQRLQRLLEQTIYLPGSTPEQITDLANVVRNIFDVKQATVQTTGGSMVIRAPEDVFPVMDRTIADLMDGGGEVMLEVKLYEVDSTRTRDIGATIPQQFTTFNVDAAATSLVNANQTLVQQAIAQGFVSSTASNLTIAEALIASGLVQSSLLTNLIGVVGGGLFQTGINGSASASFNLSLNASDTRTLDDVLMRVGDRQPATFRSGMKYPITTSTYTTGLSTPASSLSSATINGVSVASLLAQYSGGTSTTIPQVSYEDLGITLKATPTIQKTGRINLLLDMKVEALAGGSNDGIPVLGSRQFASDITVGDGESAVLSSYVTRSESAAISGIPGLSELPGFEAPIDENAEKDTGQLVVILTPHVVRRRSNMVAGPPMLIHPEPSGASSSN